MPIHNPAYRAWEGVRESEWLRWWTICSTGIQRASRSTWLKRLIFTSFFPLLFFAIPIFMFEQATRDPTILRPLAGFLRGLPRASMLQDSIDLLSRQPSAEQFLEIRREVWSYVLLTMTGTAQSFLMLVVIGIVAPPLISQDLRTRAYLIYFSRPISRLEYIFGKLGVVAFFLFVVSVAPAMILYGLGLLLSPSLDVLISTWDIPLRILLAALFFIVPTALVALAFSSMTTESRYAGFAWFAMWIVGHVTYSALTTMGTLDAGRAGVAYDPGWRLLTSPYQIMLRMQSYVYGFDEGNSTLLPALLVLLTVCVASLVVLFRKVNAPMRA
jgi:ABC-2 type transport system permease protein